MIGIGEMKRSSKEQITVTGPSLNLQAVLKATPPSFVMNFLSLNNCHEVVYRFTIKRFYSLNRGKWSILTNRICHLLFNQGQLSKRREP